MKPNDKAYEAARAAILKAMAERNCIIAGVPFNENNVDEFDAGEAIEHAKVALDAAYAAQFQSEDYAGLIDGLREWAGQYEGITLAGEEIIGQAADAIETVLADRDDFAEQLALRSESGMAKDMQEIMRINNELVAERDALLARLAPVEDDKLVAIMIKQIIDATSDMPPRLTYTISERSLAGSRAAIAAIRPRIEAAERERCLLLKASTDAVHMQINDAAIAAERERCARIADSSMLPCDIGGDLILDRYTADAIAAAIRSGK